MLVPPLKRIVARFDAASPSRLRHRVPHLDGIRGVAVLLVFADHLLAGVYPAGVSLLPGRPISLGGGFTGVQLFFVLSGLLITRLLLGELERSGSISLLSFYGRRLRRLYPVLVTAVGVYIGVGLLLQHSRKAMIVEAARVLTYSSNIIPLWANLPKTLWLNHAWSLGVEEQFYLLWPMLVLGASRFGGRNAVGIVALLGATATTLWRFNPPFEHAEYELLRWDALLVGAAWAVWTPRVMTWLAVLGTGCFAVLSSGPVDTAAIWPYLASDLGCLCLLALAPRLRVFEWPWLVHLGRISYSLYVWHLLIMRLGMPGWANLMLSLPVAELSFRFIEAPFLSTHGASTGRAQKANIPEGQGTTKTDSMVTPGEKV